MGKFEEMLQGAIRGFSPESAGAARLGGPVFDAGGALRADFSAEAVAEMLSDSQALSVLAALPEAERARLRAGLASQNRLWAEKFDTIMEDALTAPEGAMPAGQRVLPDVFEGQTPKPDTPNGSADDIAGLGAPDDPINAPSPNRFDGINKEATGGLDSKGSPRKQPIVRQGDMAAPVRAPGEARDRFSRVPQGGLLPAARGNKVPDRNLQDSLKVVLSDLRQMTKEVNPATGKKWTMDELTALPKEEIDKLVRGTPVGGAKGRTRKDGREVTHRFEDGGPTVRYKEPGTGVSKQGQKIEPAQKSRIVRDHETIREAAGFDPSAPPTSLIPGEADELVPQISNSELPNVGQRSTQPAADRAAAAVTALHGTFPQQGESIMRALRGADDQNAAEFAYAVAEAMNKRMFINTERVSPAAARDAVHGTAAALLSASGRKIDVLPDSIVEADIAAVNASRANERPRIGDQLRDMDEEEFVSRARALGEDPEVARRAFKRDTTVWNRGGPMPPRADAPEPGPLDIDAHRRTIEEFDPNIDSVIAEFVRTGHMPDRGERYTLQRWFPTEPGPGTTFRPAAPKYGPEASPDWKPDPLTGEPAPISGKASAGVAGATEKGAALPPIPAKGAKPYAEQVKDYEKALKKYEKEQKAFEAGKRTIKPNKPRKPFNPNEQIDATTFAYSPAEKPPAAEIDATTFAYSPAAKSPAAEAAPAAAQTELADVPKGGVPAPAKAKPAAEATAAAPARAAATGSEETVEGMPKSVWRDHYISGTGGTRMTPAQFEQFWEGQRARGRVSGGEPAKQGDDFELGADAADEVSSDVVIPAEPAPRADGLPAGPADELPPVPANLAPPTTPKQRPGRKPAAAAQPARTPPWMRPPIADDPIPSPAATPDPAAATAAGPNPAATGPTPTGAAAARARAAAQRAAAQAAGPQPAPQGANPFAGMSGTMGGNAGPTPNPAQQAAAAGAAPQPTTGPTPNPFPPGMGRGASGGGQQQSRGVVLGTVDRIGSGLGATGRYVKKYPADGVVGGGIAATLGALLYRSMFGEREDPMADIQPAFLPAGGGASSVGPQPQRVDPTDVANPGAPTPQTIAEYMHYKQRSAAQRRKFTGQQGYATNSMWESLYGD